MWNNYDLLGDKLLGNKAESRGKNGSAGTLMEISCCQRSVREARSSQRCGGRDPWRHRIPPWVNLLDTNRIILNPYVCKTWINRMPRSAGHYSKDEIGLEQRRIFETANRYHFIHTLALLGLPLCKFPAVVSWTSPSIRNDCIVYRNRVIISRAFVLQASTFMLSGIILFCGSCYYTAFTNNRRFSATTPIGGFCFILAWCSMFL